LGGGLGAETEEKFGDLVEFELAGRIVDNN